MDNNEDIKSALKIQEERINELSQCKINSFKGFGEKVILTFFDSLQYPDGEYGASAIQNKIDKGYYKSVEDFDSYHSSDIEFIDLYSGQRINDYREKTKQNLIKLGKLWRKRVLNEYPEAKLTIVVHECEGDWFLDTFNYPVNIENALYL